MTDDFYFDPAAAAAYDADPDLPRDDVSFYVELAREVGGIGQSVLELGCGTGRVTLPIAEAGIRITGLDRSPAMLEVARGKSTDRHNPRWVEGDMTDFTLDERFGLVIIPYRSFLLLLTVEAQKACIERVREHLLPGGRLALNFFNPDLAMMGEWLSGRRKGPEALDSRSAGAGRIDRFDTNRYSTAKQQLEHDRQTEMLSDEGAVISRVNRKLRMRYVFRYEMEHLLALSGFAVEALYGSFDRRTFADDSSEMVWIARRTP